MEAISKMLRSRRWLLFALLAAITIGQFPAAVEARVFCIGDNRCPGKSAFGNQRDHGFQVLVIAGIILFLIAGIVTGIAVYLHQRNRNHATQESDQEVNRQRKTIVSTTSVFVQDAIAARFRLKLGRSIKRIATTDIEGLQFSSQTIERVDHDRFTIWFDESPLGMSGAIWSEKVPGKGEDSTPILMKNNKTGATYGAVLDGLGGSGAAMISMSDGNEVSQAFEASRLARASIEARISQFLETEVTAGQLSQALEDELRFVLEKRAEHFGPANALLTSSLTRILPTTLAGFVIQEKKDSVTALWAGDSRTYLLDAVGGLQVLTVDDCAPMDAFESLSNDPPLQNVICADRAFTIHTHVAALTGPVLLIAASDGCFNYWPTPANFEFEILNALINEKSWKDALLALATSITSIANDDTSLVIHAVGFEGFEDVRQQMQHRYEHLRNIAFEPLMQLRSSGGSQLDFEAYRLEAWRLYKQSYEQMIGDLHEAR